MRVLTRGLVSTIAVVGIAAGSLAGAGVSFAAPAPVSKPAVNAEAVTPLAVNNLGLNTTEAKNIQCWLRGYGYTGAIDGVFGSGSQAAFKRMAAEDYPGC
ncbi:hypothetical protein ACWDWU_37010 [Streptomyces sp. NPDC003442]